MDWSKLLSKKRYYGNNKIEESSDISYRKAFHKDYDRIIFSNSFRRLSKKTQVHPLAKNDHVHNRLTHSLEVASIGRSFGLKVGEFLRDDKSLDVDPYDLAYIIQTASLAHDIGNPPFGHAGEEVIKEWFKKKRNKRYLNCLSQEELNDFIHLDGNAQSFRIVSKLENNFNKGGMRLTFATLGSLIKYPHSSSKCKEIKKSKFNYFQSEKEFFDLLFNELGLKKDNGDYRRHPLSFLMEASDDICYSLLDIQDAIELEIITIKDIEPIFKSLIGQKKTNEILNNSEYKDIQKVGKLIALSIDILVEHTLKIFKRNYNNIMEIDGRKQPKNLIDLFENDDLRAGIDEAKELANNKIFQRRRKIELELGAYNIIEIILSHMIKATYSLYKNKGDKSKLSFRDRRVLELMKEEQPRFNKSSNQNLYNMYQRVTDYIIGMTDNYATYVAHQLIGMGY